MWLDIPKSNYQLSRQGSFSDAESPSIRSPDTDNWSVSGKETSPIFKPSLRELTTTWEDDRNDSNNNANKPWRPFFLQRRALYAFMATFILMGIAIEALFIISEKRQGLATA